MLSTLDTAMGIMAYIGALGLTAPAMLGVRAAPFTLLVITLSPLPAAAFVHLVFAFALCGALRPVAWASYGVAGVAVWSVLGVTAARSVAKYLRLFQTWRQQSGSHRDQAGAVFISSGIGLLALTGFAFPALGLERTGHNHTHTARDLGLSRVGLLKKMDRMGLR